MLKKLFVAALILGCFSFSSVAQDIEGVNARLDAMGGAGVPSDFGFVIDRPLKCVDWADRIQGTGIMKEITGLEQQFGTIIATKSIIKDHFAIGLTFNNRLEMPSSFYVNYADAPYDAYWINFDKIHVMLEKFANYPRLLLGFKINDKFQFGLGGFLEHSSYDKVQKSEKRYALTPPPPNDSVSIFVDSTIDYRYIGGGGILDFKIKIGNFGINPEFKFFIPKFEAIKSGDAKDKIGNNQNLVDSNTFTNTEWTLETTDLSKNLVGKAGVKLSGKIKDAFVIGGLWYQTKRYNYERTQTFSSITLGISNPTTFDTSYVVDGGETVYIENQILFWGGFEYKIKKFDDLYFTPDYVGKWRQESYSHASGMHGDTVYTIREHKIRFAVEKPCKGFWIIKELIPRMGLTYLYSRRSKDILDVIIDGKKVDVLQNSPVTTNYKKIGDQYPGLKVSMGLGIEGKYAALDLSADILKWGQGFINGPEAALVTLTVFKSGRKP